MVINELISQEEIAEGWKQVYKKKKNFINHFNIYLSQLPPHLWNKLTIEEKYYKAKDYYIHYSVNKTKHDSFVFDLYTEINKRYYCKNRLKELLKYCLSNNITGWLIIKTQELLTKLEN
jgi:hypothetical protein